MTMNIESEIFNLLRRFIDLTIQQKKFNLGLEEENEVEVKFRAIVEAIDFPTIHLRFRLESDEKLKKSCKLKKTCFSSGFFLMSTFVSIEQEEDSFFVRRHVMHTTTNVNSLTSWQTINNWKD